MNKKYLIDEETSWISKGYRLCEEPDAKEVEVLNDEEVSLVCDGFLDSYLLLSDYLKANNLQIIKIKD